MRVVLFITTADKKQAQDIASALVAKRLAACVNIIQGVESVFRWQGKLDQQKECLLIVKSKKPLIPKLIKLVKSLHSYEVPEIIAFPIIAGNKDYLDWLDESTRNAV
jgi:periplasmic divalent cation tolerance protein